jgi:hypothetical protein
MWCLDLITPRQVVNCARQFQDAVIGAGGDVHLAHRGANQVVAGFIEFAEFAIRWGGGLEMRFWYLVTVDSEQIHGLRGCLRHPQSNWVFVQAEG